jgi:hypothetical protein
MTIMPMKKGIYRSFIALTLLICFTSTEVWSQDEEEQLFPYFDLVYLKNDGGEKILSARIYYEDEISEKSLPGLTIKFYTNQDEPVLIGEAVSGNDGRAAVSLTESVTADYLPEGEAWWFYAEFEGNERISMVSAETTITDVNLDMTLNEEEDGSRSVTLKGYTVTEGEIVNLSGEEVYLFVPRMFSLLQVGSGILEDGTVTISFPDDIPGDAEGNLAVIGRFHEHWQYGNVERKIISDWGVPASHEVAESYRALWTQIAPRWMIVTLTILLLGVWGHYIFAIVSLVRIRRLAKKQGH